VVDLTRDQRTTGVEPIGVVDMRGISRAGAVLSQARQAAVGVIDPLYRMAEEGATIDARERGVARAGAHTFETGPDGQPKLPENLPSASAFFTADRAYRQALIGRYLAESRVAATKMMADLARQHALDPDAFREAATERVRGWLEAAPEPMRVELAPMFGQMAASTYAQLSAQRTAREVAATARLAVQAHSLNVGEAQTASELGRDPEPERRRAFAFIDRQVALGVFTPAEAESRRREVDVAVAAGAALRRATALGYQAGNVWLQRFEEGREQVPGAALTPDERRSIAEIARARLNVMETLRTRGRAEAERAARAEAQAMILTNRVDTARLAELERIIPGVTRQVETAIRVQGSVMAEEWGQRRTVEQVTALAERQGVETGIDRNAPLQVQAAQARAALQEMERAARAEAERMIRTVRIDPQRLERIEEVIPGIARQVENAVRVRASSAAEDVRSSQIVEEGRAAHARRERLGLPPGPGIDASAPLAVQAEQARQLLRDEDRAVRVMSERMIASGRIDPEQIAFLESISPGITRQVQSALRTQGNAAAEEWLNEQAVAAGMALERGRFLALGSEAPVEAFVSRIDPTAPLAVQAEQAKAILREEEKRLRDERAATEAIERVMGAMMGEGALPVDNNQTNAVAAQKIATMANQGQPPDYRTPVGMAIGMRVAASGILPGPMRAELEQAAIGNDPERFVAAARVFHEGVTNEKRNVRVAFERLDTKTKMVLEGAWREISEAGAAPLAVMTERQARFRGEVSPIEDVLNRIDRVPSKREAAILKAIMDNLPSAGWFEPTAAISGQVIALARSAILHDMMMTGRTLEDSAAAVMARMGRTGVEVRDAQGNIVTSQPFAVFGPSKIGINSPADLPNRVTIVRDPPELVLAAPYNNRERSLQWVLPELKRQAEEKGVELPKDIGLPDLRLQPVYENGVRRWRVWYMVNGVMTYVSERGTAVPALFDLDTPRARLLHEDLVRRVERERERLERRMRSLAEEDVVGAP